MSQPPELTAVPETATGQQNNSSASDVAVDALADFPTTLHVLDTCTTAAKAVGEHLGEVVEGLFSGLS